MASLELEEDDLPNERQHFYMHGEDFDDGMNKDDEDDLHPMDGQIRNAYYGYAAEKSLSHADSKLFYQHHQLEQQSRDENLKTSGELAKARSSPSEHEKLQPSNDPSSSPSKLNRSMLEYARLDASLESQQRRELPEDQRQHSFKKQPLDRVRPAKV